MWILQIQNVISLYYWCGIGFDTPIGDNSQQGDNADCIYSIQITPLIWAFWVVIIKNKFVRARP